MDGADDGVDLVVAQLAAQPDALQPAEMLSPTTTIDSGCLLSNFCTERGRAFASNFGVADFHRFGAWE